jgi:ABC-2 type transport system permease protein
MSWQVTWATAHRVAQQLRGDRRTLAMIMVIPPALVTLFKFVYENQPESFDRIAVPLVGMFPLVIMFLITSISMLRERTGGTLERLMSMPLSKLDLLLGYGIAFAAVASVQAIVTSAVAFGLLGVDTEGPILLVIALAVLNAVLGMSLGLLVSAFASTEFQAVQFMPAVILPQLILGGLFVPREDMPEVLEVISAFLPFTYAFDALSKVAADDIGGRFWLDVAVVIGSIVLALVLAAATLKRRTA